jgi:hypothetical protein
MLNNSLAPFHFSNNIAKMPMNTELKNVTYCDMFIFQKKKLVMYHSFVK